MKTRLSVCFGWGLFTNEHIRGAIPTSFPSLSLNHHQFNCTISFCKIPKHTSQFSSAFFVKFVNSNLEPYTTSRYFHWTYSLQIPFIVNCISLILLNKMPKKKTGQRKKAEKQKLRQKEIRSGKETKPLCDWACNSTMVNFIFQLNTDFLISFYVK
jgi:hypothetical protein